MAAYRDRILVLLFHTPPMSLPEIVNALKPVDAAELKDDLLDLVSESLVDQVSVIGQPNRFRRITEDMAPDSALVPANRNPATDIEALPEVAAEALKQRILKVLGDAPHLSRGSIMHALGGGYSINQVKRSLAALRSAGHICARGVKAATTWSLANDTVAGSTSTAANDQKHIRRDFPGAPGATEAVAKVRSALEFNHATACEAVDLYVHSCVDTAIYESLISARASARKALDAFVRGGT